MQVSEDLLVVSEPPVWKRYAVAIGVSLVAVLARLLLPSRASTDAPVMLFYAAVMAAGWYGGFRPGLFATFLCAFLAGLSYVQSLDHLVDTWPLLRLALFLFEGAITSALCGQLHAARRRAERNAADARELERMVERISEAEQRRIGQDLHDGLGQHLTGVAFLSKALQKKLISDGRPEVAEQAATINEFVNESIRWTRDLARGLAPMDLDRTSLAESLRELVRQTSKLFNVECAYEGVESVTVRDDEMALNLYRVAQEAVSNGVKHGKAKSLTLELQIDSGLKLSITDDGVGFDLEHARAAGPEKGMGLQVMRYRARIIGGDLEIHTKVNEGTTVLCELPPHRANVKINPTSSWTTSTAAGNVHGDVDGHPATAL